MEKCQISVYEMAEVDDHPNIAPVPSMDSWVAVLCSLMLSRCGLRLDPFHHAVNSSRLALFPPFPELIQDMISSSVRGWPSISATSLTPKIEDRGKQNEGKVILQGGTECRV